MENDIDFELDLNVKCKSHPDDPTVIISGMNGGIKGNTTKEALAVALAFVVKKVLDICNEQDLSADEVLDKTNELIDSENLEHLKESGIIDPIHPINIDPKNLNA